MPAVRGDKASEAMREKVARAIYAVIDATNSDPWEEVMRRRKLYTVTAGPEVTRAFAFADAAIVAVASCLPKANRCQERATEAETNLETATHALETAQVETALDNLSPMKDKSDASRD